MAHRNIDGDPAQRGRGTDGREAPGGRVASDGWQRLLVIGVLQIVFGIGVAVIPLLVLRDLPGIFAFLPYASAAVRIVAALHGGAVLVPKALRLRREESRS